jgi:hypothetical protein
MNTFSSLNKNSPARGLRLLVNAVFVGSMRPGLEESCGSLPTLLIVVAVVEPPPGRSTKVQRIAGK